MILVRVHTAVAEQADEVQPPPVDPRLLHRLQQRRMLEQFAILDHQIDTRNVHVHDAPGADVQMSHFAVAHLSVRQSDIASAGMNKRVRKFAQQFVIRWLARQRDGIRFRGRSVTPPIQNDEHQRFGSSHELSKTLRDLRATGALLGLSVRGFGVAVRGIRLIRRRFLLVHLCLEVRQFAFELFAVRRQFLLD